MSDSRYVISLKTEEVGSLEQFFHDLVVGKEGTIPTKTNLLRDYIPAIEQITQNNSTIRIILSFPSKEGNEDFQKKWKS